MDIMHEVILARHGLLWLGNWPSPSRGLVVIKKIKIEERYKPYKNTAPRDKSGICLCLDGYVVSQEGPSPILEANILFLLLLIFCFALFLNGVAEVFGFPPFPHLLVHALALVNDVGNSGGFWDTTSQA